MLDNLKYPIGEVNLPAEITTLQITGWIETIEQFPSKLENLVKNLNEEQLDTTYRENGWTIRQVIHHCADSHTNSYIRFKWTLTENTPIIKAYFEERWAELPDSKKAPISLSINMLKSLHAKWTYLLKCLNSNDLEKEFIHPESNASVSIAQNIGIYAWHCNHHYAHIYNLMQRKNWLENC